MKVLIELDADIHTIQVALSLCDVLQKRKVDEHNYAILSHLSYLISVIVDSEALMAHVDEDEHDARQLIVLLGRLVEEVESDLESS